MYSVIESVKMSSNAEIISSFNFLNMKKIISIKEMIPHKEYAIDGSYRTKTKYGDSVVLKLEDQILYLPKRYNSLGDDLVQRLSDGAFTISKIPLSEDQDNSLCRLELKQRLPIDVFYSPYT